MKFPPTLNDTVELRISGGERHRYAAGGFVGELWIASSM